MMVFVSYPICCMYEYDLHVIVLELLLDHVCLRRISLSVSALARSERRGRVGPHRRSTDHSLPTSLSFPLSPTLLGMPLIGSTTPLFQQQPPQHKPHPGPPRPPRQPSRSAPSPLAILALIAVSCGSFVYVVNKREQEQKLIPPSERRRQFENPLIPPRQREDPK